MSSPLPMDVHSLEVQRPAKAVQKSRFAQTFDQDPGRPDEVIALKLFI
jgi:hypothetical protein